MGTNGNALIVILVFCIDLASASCDANVKKQFFDKHFLMEKVDRMEGGFGKGGMKAGGQGVVVCQNGYTGPSPKYYCHQRDNVWVLEPPLPTANTILCVEKPSCDVSLLSSLATSNNLVVLDKNRQKVEPGKSFQYKCKTGHQKASSTAVLDALCNSQAEWKHTFQTNGNKICVPIVQCTRSGLGEMLAHHNMKHKSVFDSHRLGAGPFDKGGKTPINCKNGFTGVSYMSAVCNSDGSWGDSEQQRRFTANGTPLCSAEMSKCTLGQRTYKHGADMPNLECNTCTCQDGARTCSQNSCPKCTKASLLLTQNNLRQYNAKQESSSPGEVISLFCAHAHTPDESIFKKSQLDLECKINSDGSAATWQEKGNDNALQASYTNAATPLCTPRTTCSRADLNALISNNDMVLGYVSQSTQAQATYWVTKSFRLQCATGKGRTTAWSYPGAYTYVRCDESGEWTSPKTADETLLKASGEKMCVTQTIQNSCATTRNGKSFSMDDGSTWPKDGDNCQNTCTCDDGTVECTSATCSQCSKTDLINKMNEKNLMYYSSHYENYVQDSNPPGRPFIMKCKDGFNHQETSRRELLRYASESQASTYQSTYAQSFQAKCGNDGSWTETTSNCVGSTTKSCSLTFGEKTHTVAHGETVNDECNSCTCNDGTCLMSEKTCVNCNNADLTTIKTNNALIDGSYPLRGITSPVGTATTLRCGNDHSLLSDITSSSRVVAVACSPPLSGNVGIWKSAAQDVQLVLGNTAKALCVPEAKCSKSDLTALMATHKMEYANSKGGGVSAENDLNTKSRLKCQSGHNHPSLAAILEIKCTPTKGTNEATWRISGAAWETCVKQATCSKTDLVTFMNDKNMAYFSTTVEKYMSAENPRNAMAYLKCKEGYNQETKQEIADKTTTTTVVARPSPTYVFVRCGATGNWELDTRSESVTCGIATCSKQDLETLMASNNIALVSNMNKDTASVNDQVSLKCQADTIMNKYATYDSTSFDVTCKAGTGWSSSAKNIQYILGSASRKLCVECGCPCVKCAVGSTHECCKDFTCTTTSTNWETAGVKLNDGKSLSSGCTSSNTIKTCTCTKGVMTCVDEACQTCSKSDFDAALVKHNLVRDDQNSVLTATNQKNTYQRVGCKDGYSMHRETKSSFSSFGMVCGSDGQWSTPSSTTISHILSSTESLTTVCAVKQASCAVGKKYVQDGQSYKEECNECSCNNGVISCTKRRCGCLNGKVKHGQRYKVDGCNTCTCNSAGAPLACTRMLCKPTCKKSDLSALMNTKNLDWYSSRSQSSIRKENRVGEQIKFKCKKNTRKDTVQSNSRSLYPYIACLTDSATKVTAWSADTCVEIPTQQPCSVLAPISNAKSVYYSDRSSNTKKIGSTVQVTCDKGFKLTGLKKSKGWCTASKDGQATFSNVVLNPLIFPECTRLPFRVGTIETVPNSIDTTKCPFDKPIYGISQLCTVSDSCRNHVVSLFDTISNFQTSRYTSRPVTDAQHDQYKSQITAVAATCATHSVCALKYNKYERAKEYFTTLKSKTYGKGANARPRYNGKYLMRKVCPSLKSMGCCFRDFLKSDVSTGDPAAIELDSTLSQYSKHCRNLATKTCADTCQYDKTKEGHSPVQCTVASGSGTTINRSFKNRGHAICELQDKYQMSQADAKAASTDSCHASKCEGLGDGDCNAHPLCESKADSGIAKCDLTRANKGKICVVQDGHRRRLAIPDHPHGRRMSNKADSIDASTGYAVLATGILGTTKTNDPEACGKFCEDKGAFGCELERYECTAHAEATCATVSEASQVWDTRYSYSVICSSQEHSTTKSCRPKACDALGGADKTIGNCNRLNHIARNQGIASSCVWRGESCSAKITLAMNHDMMSNLWKKDRTNEAIKTERIVDSAGRVKQSYAELKSAIGGAGAAAEGEDIDLDLSTTGEETKIELGSEDDGESKDMVLGSITIGTDDADTTQEVKIGKGKNLWLKQKSSIRKGGTLRFGGGNKMHLGDDIVVEEGARLILGKGDKLVSDSTDGDSGIKTIISGEALIESGEAEIETDLVISSGGSTQFNGKGCLRLKKGAIIDVGDKAELRMTDSRQTIKGDGELRISKKGRMNIKMKKFKRKIVSGETKLEKDASIRRANKRRNRALNRGRGAVKFQIAVENQGTMNIDDGAIDASEGLVSTGTFEISSTGSAKVGKISVIGGGDVDEDGNDDTSKKRKRAKIDGTLDISKDATVEFGTNVEGQGNLLAQDGSTMNFQPGYTASFNKPVTSIDEEDKEAQRISTHNLAEVNMPSQCRKCTGDNDVSLVAVKMEIVDKSSASGSKRVCEMTYDKTDVTKNKISALSVGDAISVDGTGNRDLDEEEFTVTALDPSAGIVQFDVNEHKPIITREVNNTSTPKQGEALNQIKIGKICDDNDADVISCVITEDGEDATTSEIKASAFEKRKPSMSNMRKRILDLGLETKDVLDDEQIEEEDDDEDDEENIVAIKVKADDPSKLASRLADYERDLTICRQTTKTDSDKNLTRKVIRDLIEARDADMPVSGDDDDNDNDNVDNTDTSLVAKMSYVKAVRRCAATHFGKDLTKRDGDGSVQATDSGVPAEDRVLLRIEAMKRSLIKRNINSTTIGCDAEATPRSQLTCLYEVARNVSRTESHLRKRFAQVYVAKGSAMEIQQGATVKMGGWGTQISCEGDLKVASGGKMTIADGAKLVTKSTEEGSSKDDGLVIGGVLEVAGDESILEADDPTIEDDGQILIGGGTAAFTKTISENCLNGDELDECVLQLGSAPKNGTVEPLTEEEMIEEEEVGDVLESIDDVIEAEKEVIRTLHETRVAATITEYSSTCDLTIDADSEEGASGGFDLHGLAIHNASDLSLAHCQKKCEACSSDENCPESECEYFEFNPSTGGCQVLNEKRLNISTTCGASSGGASSGSGNEITAAAAATGTFTVSSNTMWNVNDVVHYRNNGEEDCNGLKHGKSYRIESKTSSDGVTLNKINENMDAVVVTKDSERSCGTLTKRRLVMKNTKLIQEEELKEALIERDEIVEDTATRQGMSQTLKKYSMDYHAARRLMGKSKKEKSQRFSIAAMNDTLIKLGIRVPETVPDENDVSDVHVRKKMQRRRFLKRSAQLYRLLMFRRSVGSEKDAVNLEDIETATIALHEKDQEESPLVTHEETDTKNDRALKWLDNFDIKAQQKLRDVVRKPKSIRSKSGSKLLLKKGGPITIGDMNLEADLVIEKDATVKVTGVFDLTTMESEIEIDDKEEEDRFSATTRRRRRLSELSEATNVDCALVRCVAGSSHECCASAKTKKGVSTTEGNLELDGDAALLVDEMEFKGKVNIGTGSTLKIQPSTRDKCRKQKCKVTFGGVSENDEQENDTDEMKLLKTEKRKLLIAQTKKIQHKRRCRQLLRDDIANKEEKDAVQVTVDAVKLKLVEKGVIEHVDDPSVDTADKVFEKGADAIEKIHQAKAYVAKKGMNMASDGGGRRRLSETVLTSTTIAAALAKDGMPTDLDCDDISEESRKNWCSIKTAAAVQASTAGDSQLSFDVEKTKGKSVVESLKSIRNKLRKERKKDASDAETKSTEEESIQEMEDDDKLDLENSPSGRLELLKRVAKFIGERDKVKVEEKQTCVIEAGGVVELGDGTVLEVKKNSVVAVKGKLKAPKNTITEVKGILDMTSSDGEGVDHEDVDTTPEIGGKLEVRGGQAKMDELELGAEAVIESKEGGTIKVVASKKTKHARTDTKKHVVKLGVAVAELSNSDAAAVKETKKQLFDDADVIEELNKENIDINGTKRDVTIENIVAQLKVRGVVPNDGSEDGTVDTLPKAKRKLAKYVRAKKTCLKLLRRSDALTASLNTGATFSKGDVKTAIKETSNTAEGKAILEAKSSLWELYQACMEKSRVLTLLQRRGMKNKGNDLSTEDATIKIEIAKRSRSSCIYQTVDNSTGELKFNVNGSCICSTGYEGENCDKEQATNSAEVTAELFEQRVKRLANELAVEDEEALADSVIVVDETSQFEIEDGAVVQSEGGRVQISGGATIKGTFQIKKDAILDLTSREKESSDMVQENRVVQSQCAAVRCAPGATHECCSNSNSSSSVSTEITGDLVVGDTAKVQLDSLSTKSTGRFQVKGRATVEITKDPRKGRGSEGVVLGTKSSKNTRTGKSTIEKKTRLTKTRDQYSDLVLQELLTEQELEEPTKEVLNKALRDLGAMNSDKGIEPDVDKMEARQKLAAAYWVKRRAKNLICSDREVRRAKEKHSSNSVLKKRCRNIEPSIEDLKTAIEGRGLEVPNRLTTVGNTSVAVLRWDLWKVASRTRVMGTLLAKNGAYKENTADIEESKTIEERTESIKNQLKGILKANKLKKIYKQQQNNQLEAIEEEIERNRIKNLTVVAQEEDIEKERECTVCLDVQPTCLPTCLKCVIQKATCSECSVAVCADDVGKEIDELVTLDQVLEKVAEEQENKDEEEGATFDFATGPDSKVNVDGGRLVVEGTSKMSGKVVVKRRGKIVCGRGSELSFENDDDLDDYTNAAEEDGIVTTSLESGDDPLDETPQVEVDGVIEMGIGSEVNMVGGVLVGPEGEISGPGQLNIKADPRTVAVKEDVPRSTGSKEKKWRSKPSVFTIESTGVMDDSAREDAKAQKKEQSNAKKGQTYLTRKGMVVEPTNKEELLAAVKALQLDRNDDGSAKPDDELDEKECMARLAKANENEERTNKMILIGLASVKKANKGHSMDVNDKVSMIEEGLNATISISASMLKRAKATKGGIVHKDLYQTAAKVLRYARVMKKRGVKKTKSDDPAEQTKIFQYAKTYVKESFRGKATQAEKDAVDAELVKIRASYTVAGTTATEKDEVIEEIALWDEMESNKDIEQSSLRVSGPITIEMGGELQMKAHTTVKSGTFNMDKDSAISVESGGRLVVERDDENSDDEFEDESEEGLEAEGRTVEKKKKMVEIKEGATLDAELGSELQFERPLHVQGKMDVRGTLEIQNDVKVGHEEEVDTVVEAQAGTPSKGTVTLSGAGAVLSGVGRMVAKSIDCRGCTIKPGNSPGTFRMEGDVALDSESVVQFEIMDTATDQYDVLEVSGRMTLGGTMNLDAGDNCLVPVTVIKTQNQIDGEFDTFNNGATTGAAGSKTPDGYDYTVGCAPCVANEKVVVDGAATSMGTCTACPDGKTNTKGDVPWGAATECDTPIVKCQVGEHVSNGACVACPAGSSRDQEDTISAGDTSCTITYCQANEHVQNNQCVACAAGTSRPEGDDATVQFDTTCVAVQCADDHHSVNHVCTPCPAGTTMTGATSAQINSDSICTKKLCGVGEHVVDHVCTSCPTGQDNDAGDDASGSNTTCSIIVCPKDFHVSDTATTPVCRPCDQGTFNDRCDQPNVGCDVLTEGDTVCSNADDYCAVNERSVGGACVSCAAGTEQSSKVYRSGTDTNCSAVTCDKDEYVSNHQCVACPAGTALASGSDASGSDTMCSAVTCSEDFHVLNHACVACASGEFVPAGGDASSSDTTCSPSECAKDYYVNNARCRQCASGTYRDLTNGLGDLTNGLNTVCEPEMCTENQHVKNDRCAGCSRGKTRPAGDSSADGATECTATLCAKDEYVLNNVCVACQPGWVRAAGADASKDNNQDKCTEPEGIAISGSFTLSSITLEDAKTSEDIIKKVIGEKYKMELKYITIDSIEEAGKSNGKDRFLASHVASGGVVVRYTIKGFADQATADQAKENFEETVKDGSFVTGLRSENNSMFTSVQVTNGTPDIDEAVDLTLPTPSSSSESSEPKVIAITIPMMIGMIGGVAFIIVLIVVVMKKKGNSTANDNEENRTKVTPITPGQQETDDIRNWTHGGASVNAMDNAKHVGRSMLQ